MSVAIQENNIAPWEKFEGMRLEDVLQDLKIGNGKIRVQSATWTTLENTTK
jgi:hypothetical protein